MTETRILRHVENGLCTLTLNRPDKRNALDTASFEELDAHLAWLEQASDEVGCVVLKANGPSFCAGADLKGIGSAPVDPRFKPGVIERLATLPQPIVAQIHGVCFTGGLELALACDLIVADASAQFADTHGKWGLVGAWGMMQRLPRRISAPRAKLMMMTGRVSGANEAYDVGLIDILVGAGELDLVVGELASDILANSWHTNFAVKSTMYESDGVGIADALARENYRYKGYAPDWKDRVARFSK